jgi:hypothetical protein
VKWSPAAPLTRLPPAALRMGARAATASLIVLNITARPCPTVLKSFPENALRRTAFVRWRAPTQSSVMFSIEEVAIPATVVRSAGLVNARCFPTFPSAPSIRPPPIISRLKTSPPPTDEHEARISWRLRPRADQDWGTDRQVGTFRVWLAANVCASIQATVQLDFPLGSSLGRRLPPQARNLRGPRPRKGPQHENLAHCRLYDCGWCLCPRNTSGSTPWSAWPRVILLVRHVCMRPGAFCSGHESLGRPSDCLCVSE